MQNNLLKILSIIFILTLFMYPRDTYAQLSGIKTIPGDYTTIAMAIDSLNALGVGSGGVTFNVAAGYTESITVPILLTATGTTGNDIIFQKNGVGANPIITRTDAGTLATSILGGQGDAVIIIQGSDYVTFDAIDVASSDQGIEYGYYLRKTSDTDGCKFVTIKNALIDLNKGTSAFVAGIYSSNNDATSLVSSATGITITSTGGRNENITITGNQIQDVFAGIVLRGFNHTTVPYDFYDQNFLVGANGAGNIIQNYAGNTAATTYGVYLIYHNNVSVSYNTINNNAGGGSSATSILYGIYNSSGTQSSFTANNNIVNVTTSATASAIYGINNAGTGNLTLNNNTITINTTASNTGVVGYIYNTSAAASLTVSISNNTFVGTSLSVTGSTYLIYNNSSQLTPGVTNVQGNSILGLVNRTGATGTTYCYYNNGSPTGIENIFNNVFDSVTTTGTGALYGILSTTGAFHTHNIYNNTVSNFSGGTGTTYGIHRTLASGNIYSNSVYNLSGGGTVWGISCGTGNVSINKNSIYSLSSASTGTTVGTVTGIYLSGSTNTYIFNNFVSDLKASGCASTDAIRGIGSISTTAASNIGLYYNTIFLNASSTGANFGTSGIFHTNSTTATVAALDMRNNIVVNTSTPTGTGLTVAYRRSAVNPALNNYSTISNYNDFYAGIPGTANLIFNDGTNSDQTMAQFKARVSPRESASISENPTFVNSITPPFNLRINITVPSQLESGAAPVTNPLAITDDFDGDLRTATTPDIGADEFEGLALDLTPPVISYNSLLNTGSISARTLTVNISDASGVPTVGIGLPVLYWAINSGTYSNVQATFISGGQYSFTFGAGVVLGDTVRYYLIAQDNSTTPNVGSFPSVGASGFTANPPAVSTPPTSPSSYVITAIPLAGDYTVGLALFNSVTGKNISFERTVKTVLKEIWVANPESDIREEAYKPVIYGDKNSGEYKLVEVDEVTWIAMESGTPYDGPLYAKKVDDPKFDLPKGIEGIYATITAAMTDLNLRGVISDVNFLLTDSLYSTGESFPILANITNENLPTLTKKVTIKPSSGVTSKISGSSTSGIFVSFAVDCINIDGSNSGGTDRSLTFENTNSAANAYVIGIFNNGVKGAQNNSIKNCIVKAGGTVNNTWSIILNALGGGYNNTTVQNNLLLNSRIALQFVGVSGGITTGGSITQNIFGSDIDLESVGNLGIITQYVDSLVISRNTFKNFKVGNNPTGISISTGSINTTISKNLINGMIYTGTGGYGGKGIAINTGALTSNLTIDNNVIYNITGDGWNTFATDANVGIRITGTTGGINIYYNSVNMYGNADRSATATLSAALYIIGTTGGLDFRNNVFSNSLVNTLNTGSKAYSIYNAGTNTAFTTINNNDYYASGVQGVLGFQTIDVLTIEGWRIATGQDVSSIATNPIFVSNSDIRPQISSPLISAGTNIAGFTTDFLGVTRNATTPTIGSYEQGVVVPLAGDYYIPKGSNPNGFATLEAAIVSLNTAGASGQVRFLIDDNLNEIGANLLITRSDLTAANNLIIKPAPTKTPTLSITGASTVAGANQYSGISYSGASYITIDGSNIVGGTTRDLTIAMNDSLNGRIGIQLFGNTDFIVIRNLYLKFNVINLVNASTRGIYANGQATGVADSLIIENCQIADLNYAPAYSISITGSSGSLLFASKVNIKNNDLYGVMRPVYFFYGGAAGTTSEISNNVIIQSYPAITGNVIWGMLFNTFDGTFNILGNKVQRLVSITNATQGIYGIGTLASQPSVIMNIYNNFLGGDFQHNGTGIPASIDVLSFQDNIPQANVYHNTIALNNMTKTASGRMTGVRWGGTANVTLRNNIIINEKDASVAFALYNAGGTFTSNYNDLYVSGASANIGFSGVARQSFQTWQDSTGQDANSVNVDAPFTAALDFHIPDGTLTSLESAGTPIALVTTDIDGQARNLSTPDIGADEFAGLLQINSPSNLTAVADTFAILLNWNDNSTNELGFYIERKDGDSLSVNPFAVIDTVGTGVVAYNDLGRTPNTTYSYRLQAYNLLGVSPYSNVVTATTIIPVELTSFVATISEKEISVMWSTATELNNRGFELERKLNAEWQKVVFIEGKGTTTEKSDYSYSDKFKYDGFQGTIQYRLKQIDFDGTSTYSKAISVEVDFTPKEYTLYQNYPNPFNPSTTIKFALPFDSNVRITIYNLLGEQVEVIFDQVKEVGYHNVSWNASSLASGVYIYSIDAKSIDGLKNFNSVKKMMLVK